jgi:hydrogenase expression/formation protein HypC
MCLAIPVKVTKITGTLADVDMGGTKRQADIRFLDNIKPGDYILVHAGFAIEKINAKEARETLKLLKDIYYD